jgi:hypothetical protein
MDRFARALAFALTLAAAAVCAGCSGGGLLPESASAAADAPGGTLKDDDPASRPIGVAWTSARAHRCGFYFDPAKLKASYLAYEARQSPPEQLAKAEKNYDATFRMIRERVSADPDYCTSRKSAEIKADLTRHLAGDFTPKFPKPKVVEGCGFFGCPEARPEKWDADKWWADEASKRLGER